MQTVKSLEMKVGTDQERQAAVLRQLWLQDINVRAKDGTVVLSGVVGSYEEKIAAGEAAMSVFGVKGVANYLAVRP